MKHDVIVIGGSYAGMAAALQLVRARRRVLIVDAGNRRNRMAAHAHGFLGQDGGWLIAVTARAVTRDRARSEMSHGTEPERARRARDAPRRDFACSSSLPTGRQTAVTR